MSHVTFLTSSTSSPLLTNVTEEWDNATAMGISTDATSTMMSSNCSAGTSMLTLSMSSMLSRYTVCVFFSLLSICTTRWFMSSVSTYTVSVSLLPSVLTSLYRLSMLTARCREGRAQA